ncbi:uncharacterized protein LOC101864362 [Aplysia californica]|uniref:Uncharacterized protein LOC101864362 n=1 Tax=Aplysia californica TaxID=6500 RepID=A0ABM0KB21_APLCA|nr:uncharacterized protein LOC101864362 [Aplysia californica]
MRESFHKQIEDLRLKLEEAEKRALENLELASSKDLHYEKQLQDMESEITKQRLSTIDSDTQLRAKISTLEAELTELTAARDMEREESKSRIDREFPLSCSGFCFAVGRPKSSPSGGPSRPDANVMLMHMGIENGA